ncbi:MULTISPECIES: glycine cleavage system protein GcvH [unclassified Microbacterium]|uniref:glycine cleavage system protein GcvH n=1 Tax=unclassified Microbacterium TaxID=2609290 RepID=UPI00097F1A95|nr:glycine cleavage system protein GcvH [Microbacterium sp. JB110]RCS61977.1 glycine cleavage system protein GcvH [Microbacterium sp. JB110]SJM66981.1 Glycine cleavage system H protein [Frigoribacterium sp. JB110]
MTALNALGYTSEHEWVAVADGIATIGITDYAAEQLGDIVYVDLPTDNATLTSGQVMGELESTKSVSELFAPVDGEVIELNGQVDVDPALVNRDPFGDGWLVRVQLFGQPLAGLLDRAAYLRLTGGEE